MSIDLGEQRANKKFEISICESIEWVYGSISGGHPAYELRRFKMIELLQYRIGDLEVYEVTWCYRGKRNYKIYTEPIRARRFMSYLKRRFKLC